MCIHFGLEPRAQQFDGVGKNKLEPVDVQLEDALGQRLQPLLATLDNLCQGRTNLQKLNDLFADCKDKNGPGEVTSKLLLKISEKIIFQYRRTLVLL